MWEKGKRISATGALVWIVCLAFLAVGARNFEQGLSVDAPLYASFARHIVRSHEWFYLYGGIPDFNPWVDHPHLGFWVQALAFKVLPFADWSARMVGHLYYVAFLLMFFVYIRRVSDEKVAVWTILLLWIWGRFSNFFSNVYLDPGALFFGAASVFLWQMCMAERRVRLAPAAGFCLALCALYKGLTVLGFLPAWAVLVFVHRGRREELKDIGICVAWAAGAAVLPCLAYLIALHYSRVPHFLSAYWGSQMTHRFEKSWSWSSLFGFFFWRELMRDSYFLPLLSLGIFLPGRERSHLLLPLVLFVTFVFMYAPAGRVGGQYELMLLPWLAWLTAEGVFARVPVAPVQLVRGSAAIALFAVCLVQYLPIRTHGVEPPMETNELLQLGKKNGIRRMVYDNYPEHPWFISSAPYAWYADIDVDYADLGGKITPADPSRAYVLIHPQNAPFNPARGELLKKAGWCVYGIFPTPLYGCPVLAAKLKAPPSPFATADTARLPLRPWPGKPRAS